MRIGVLNNLRAGRSGFQAPLAKVMQTGQVVLVEQILVVVVAVLHIQLVLEVQRVLE